MATGESRKNQIKDKIKAAKYQSLRFWRGKGSFLKRSFRKRWLAGAVAAVLIAGILVGTFWNGRNGALAGTYTWTQSAWNGGLDGGTGAAHPTNVSNWTKYDSKDATVTAGAGSVTLAQTTGSDQDTLTADFTGTNSNTTNASDKIALTQASQAYTLTQTNNSTTTPTAPGSLTGGFNNSGNVKSNTEVLPAGSGGEDADVRLTQANKTVIYVDPVTQTGALGGRSGADAICAASANKPADATKIKAFLSVSASDEIRDMHVAGGDASHYDSSKPLYWYNASTGASSSLVGNNWADILDGSISNSQNTGTGMNYVTWSGSLISATGAIHATHHCTGWTNDTGAVYGNTTNSTSTVAAWMSSTNASCDTPTRVRCIAEIPAYYATTATYTSYVDSGAAIPTWNNFQFTKGSTAGGAGSVTVQVNASDSSASAPDFSVNGAACYVSVSADGSSGSNDITTCSVTVVPGSCDIGGWDNQIDCENDGGNWTPMETAPLTGRYLWYRASLLSVDTTKSPLLNDFAANVTIPSFQTSGTYTSPILDTGHAQAWGATTFATTDVSGGSVAVKERSCNDAACSGETALASCAAVTSGADPSGNGCVNDGDQYIQYSVALTGDGTSTPSLNDITLNYYYYSQGTLTSSPYNTADAKNKISDFYWTGTETAGTDVRLQIRAAGSQGGLTGAWCGPTACNGTDYYAVASNAQANTILASLADRSNDQWVQYKMILVPSSDGANTPTVNSVVVKYNFNEAPTLAQASATTQSSGNVLVNYNILDIDATDLSQSSQNVQLGYQLPGVTVNSVDVTDSSTSNVLLNNPNSYTIPTSGNVLINSELLGYLGVLGNGTTTVTLTGISRAQNFTTNYPTAGAAHTADTAVFFQATQLAGTNSYDTVTSVTTSASTTKTITWNAKAENSSGTSLNGGSFTGANKINLKIFANDAFTDAGLPTNNIGVVIPTAVDLDFLAPTITNISSDKVNGSYKAGEVIDVDLTFSENITTTGTITVTLETGSTDRTCTFSGVTNAGTATCNYTVQAGDTSADLTVNTVAGTIADQAGNAMTNFAPTTNLAANKALVIDTTAPTAAVTYSINRDVKAGDSQIITATFSEAMLDAPIPKVAISGGNTLAATNMTKTDTTHYAYTHTVGAGNGTATVALSVGTDAASNVITAAPTSGATFTVDNTAPTSPGTATLNSYLNNTGNQTVSWTQSTETNFKNYLVQRKLGVGGTFATIRTETTIGTTSYADNSALAEGSYYYQVIAEDNAGNTTTGGTSTVLVVDKIAPVLQSFTSSSTNSDPGDPLTMYGTGDTINIQAVFNENLANGATMTVRLNNTAQSQVLLNQIAGATLSGTYTVSAAGSGVSDDSPDLSIGQIVTTSVTDAAGNLRSSETIPAGQNLGDNKNLIVDTVPPSLSSFSAASGSYNAGDAITVVANYSESVQAGSQIQVKVNADGGVATIDLTTVSAETISGTYTVQAGDNAANLQVTSIVAQSVSDIKNNQLTNTDMPGTNIAGGALVDTTAPVIAFTDDVAAGPVQSDDIVINVVETNSASYKYIFSADATCADENYAGGTTFGSDDLITINTETNNTKYICVKAIDTAGNAAYQAGVNPLNIDITNPDGTITVDRSLGSGQIALTATDGSRGITGLQMRSVIHEDDAAACDLSAATWGDFAATLDLDSESALVKACVEYRDVAGNTTTLSAAPPRTPESFQYYDVSDPDDFRVFLSWKIPTGHEGSKGFSQYQLFQCADLKDNADCTPDTTGVPTTTISQQSTNYKTYLSLTDANKYCQVLRFASQDADGTDYSAVSEKRCVVPSSASSSVTKDVAIEFPADPVPDAELFANQATIHWTTVNANNAEEPLPADSQVCWRVHMVPTPNWNCRSYESYEVSHAITISKATERLYDLLPDTEYDYQVRSRTSWNKEATADGPATFTTKNGPVIKNINPDPIGNTTATITWTTENKNGADLASSSALYYAAEVDADGALVTPAEGACDGSDVVGHTCTLSGLSVGTQYYFYVESIANSATARDTANGAFHRFTTFSDSAAPSITANPGNPLIVTDTQAALAWETDERSTSWLLYDTVTHAAFDNFVDLNFDPDNANRNPYADNLSGDSSNLAHTFIMSLDSLAASTPYYYRLVSEDTSGNVSVSAEYTFTTLEIQSAHPALTNPGNPLVAQFSDTEAVIYLPAANTEATSKLCWDTATIADVDSCANHTEINTATKTHYFHLTGLTPETTYYLRTKITDSETADTNFTSSAAVTFTTLATQVDQHAPLTAISNVTESLVTDVAAVVNFDTDAPAVCMIQSGTATGNYTNDVAEEDGYAARENFNLHHAININGLIFSTKYYYQINCEDDLETAIADPSEYDFTTEERMLTQAGFAALGDVIAPNISGVSAGTITGESVTVSWDTNEKAGGSVAYGIESGTYENMASDYLINSAAANYVTAHAVIINGLVPATKYYFVVLSADAAGNITKSSESSFTTASPSSLSSINVASLSLNQATITWKTSAKTTSGVEYGLTEEYGQKKENSAMATEHTVTLSGLQSGQTYHFRVKGKDANNNLYSSGDYTFQPKSPPQISGVKVTGVTEHETKINFKTNIATDALIIYTDAKNPENSGSQGNPQLGSSHEIILKNLASGATFSYSVKVRDEQGNETTQAGGSFTTGKDENPPKLDQIRTDSALAQNGKVQSIVSWTTDEPATSVFAYREGISGEEKEVNISKQLTLNHVAVVTIFKPGTVYYFRVKSVDASENVARSGDFALLTPKIKENIVQIIIGNFQDIFSWAKL
ncbi:MAG: fibronectin type III domain-containing protein [Parcubacteria group bacterium]|jgi:hypothetical protein